MVSGGIGRRRFHSLNLRSQIGRWPADFRPAGLCCPASAARFLAPVSSVGRSAEPLINGKSPRQFVPAGRCQSEQRACLHRLRETFRAQLRFRGCIVHKLDRWRTWSIPLRVNDDRTSNDQFFPAVAVNGQGVIGVIWYDRRRDPNNLLIDVYSAKSTNDGVSFHANQRVKSVSSPPTVGYDPVLVYNT